MGQWNRKIKNKVSTYILPLTTVQNTVQSQHLERKTFRVKVIATSCGPTCSYILLR